MQAQEKQVYYPENHKFDLLTVPTTLEDLDQLYKQKECYEKIYNIKFMDLGAFVSYIVAEQMHEPKTNKNP